MSIFLFNLSMASSTPTRPSLEIISLNCQGLRSTDHRETLFSWLNCCKVDFLCLQETHSISEAEFTSWLKSANDDDLLTIDYNCLSSPSILCLLAPAIRLVVFYVLNFDQALIRFKFVLSMVQITRLTGIASLNLYIKFSTQICHSFSAATSTLLLTLFVIVAVVTRPLRGHVNGRALWLT